MKTRTSDGTVTPPTIDFTEDAVKEYLDECISRWRGCAPTEGRQFSIDAFQSVRVSIFGELLPMTKDS